MGLSMFQEEQVGIYSFGMEELPPELKLTKVKFIQSKSTEKPYIVELKMVKLLLGNIMEVNSLNKLK
jgi:hypothetical protein